MKSVKINVGDYVRYKINPMLNGGLEMRIEKERINEKNIKEFRISYFDSSAVHKELWLTASNLIFVKEG
jgi:hypothetical protein